jgi:integrase/recombinase XerD
LQSERRHLHPDVIDRIPRKYARKIGLARGYSPHSMRATFITTALDNGASLEDVQRAAGHADPSTTKLYDRRGYNPEKSSSFFANY